MRQNPANPGEWQVVQRYVYDPYGRVTFLAGDWSKTLGPDGQPNTADDGTASAVGNTTLYTGRELDVESGLYYYRARYYSPALGRFLTRDPIGYLAGLNLYEYVSNSPTTFTDPLGLEEVVVKGAWDTIEKQLPATIGEAKYEYGVFPKGTISTWQDKGSGEWCARFAGQFPGRYISGTTHVPKWIDRKDATKEQEKAWDDFVARVSKHEQGHLDTTKKAIEAWNKTGEGSKKHEHTEKGKTRDEASKKLAAWLKKMTQEQTTALGQEIDKEQDKYHERVGTHISFP